MIKMSPCRLTRNVFEYDLGWSFEFKQILSTVGCNDVIQKIGLLLKSDQLSKHCNNSIVKKWENTRFNKPKLKSYNIYKISHSLENYAKNNSSRLKGSALAQFCGGILPINNKFR